MRTQPLFQKRASRRAIKKALKALTLKEKAVFLKALAKRKDLDAPEHKIMFSKHQVFRQHS